MLPLPLLLVLQRHCPLSQSPSSPLATIESHLPYPVFKCPSPPNQSHHRHLLLKPNHRAQFQPPSSSVHHSNLAATSTPSSSVEPPLLSPSAHTPSRLVSSTFLQFPKPLSFPSPPPHHQITYRLPFRHHRPPSTTIIDHPNLRTVPSSYSLRFFLLFSLNPIAKNDSSSPLVLAASS